MTNHPNINTNSSKCPGRATRFLVSGSREGREREKVREREE